MPDTVRGSSPEITRDLDALALEEFHRLRRGVADLVADAQEAQHLGLAHDGAVGRKAVHARHHEHTHELVKAVELCPDLRSALAQHELRRTHREAGAVRRDAARYLVLDEGARPA